MPRANRLMQRVEQIRLPGQTTARVSPVQPADLSRAPATLAVRGSRGISVAWSAW